MPKRSTGSFVPFVPETDELLALVSVVGLPW